MTATATAGAGPGAAWRLLLDATVRTEPAGVAMVVASVVAWMAAAALIPAILARAVDRGVVGGDSGALAVWSAALVGVSATEAAAGAVRHWYAVRTASGPPPGCASAWSPTCTTSTAPSTTAGRPASCSLA
ncbi:MAG: hypothetical protein M3Q48_09335 [Actinomycetota bacterium]|nr:hypothetical protein [Actinomycetota bacterium]